MTADPAAVILDPAIRRSIETRLRSAWQQQQAAELRGDEARAAIMRADIDQTLDRLAAMLTATT